MPVRDYLEGLAFLLGTWGAVGTATAILVRRRLSHLRGAPLACAAGIVATAGLLAVHIVPLMLGVLSRPAVLSVAALLLVGTLWVPRAAERSDATLVDRRGIDSLPSVILATIGVGVVGVATLVFLRAHASEPVLHIDTMSFHLPGVARWIQSRSIWSNDEFLPRFPTGTYPENGDVVFLAAVLPFRNDAFVRLVNVPFLALAGLAIYAIGRELGAPSPTAALFAAGLVSMRVVASFAVDQLDPDIVLVALFGSGALFLLRHFRTGRTAELGLAGVGLGIAFGTKWYGVSAVLILIAVWAGIRLWARHGRRVVGRQGAALLALVLASGGVWLVRNWVVVGNPVFPLRVRIGGFSIFGAPNDLYRKLYGYTILGRLDQWRSWRDYILPDWRHALGLPAGIIVVGLVCALAVAIANRRRRSHARVLMLGIAGVLITAAYTITPATAQGFADRPFAGLVGSNARTVVPALILAAGAGAWWAGRRRVTRRIVESMMVIGVLDGVHETFHPSSARLAVFAALLAALFGLVWTAWRILGLRGPVARRIAVVGIAVAVGAVAGGYGNRIQEHFNAGRYEGIDATVDWILANAPSGHRIGIAGGYAFNAELPTPILPAFGPQYRNDVSYVGRVPHGILLPITNEAAFVASLRARRYDLVEVGLHDPSRIGGGSGHEAEWARAAGFRSVAKSDRFELLAAPWFHE